MRLRRKKNIDTRLRACADILMLYQPEDRRFDGPVSDAEQLDLAVWFGNEHPVELEIGCGKGGFICEMARRRPDVNFIAVERSDNVIVMAAERAQQLGLRNVRFVATYAEYLPHLFPHHFADRLYLNFSCPFPKTQYATHRLTHPCFLRMYADWLREDGSLIQKTDSRELFEFSLLSLSQAGFSLNRITLDLHNSDVEGNIETEYEQRFVAMGKPIYYLETSAPTVIRDLN